MTEIKINDNGTLRAVQRIFVNDNGTLREIMEGFTNDSGVLRQVFSGGEVFVNVFPNPSSTELFIGDEETIEITIYASKAVTWSYTLPSEVTVITETSTSLELEASFDPGDSATFSVSANGTTVTVEMGEREEEQGGQGGSD